MAEARSAPSLSCQIKIGFLYAVIVMDGWSNRAAQSPIISAGAVKAGPRTLGHKARRTSDGAQLNQENISWSNTLRRS